MYPWSKSSLKSLLEGCSWQWALRKVYEIEDHGSPQTAMGTGVHKAIEEWDKSERSLSMEEMQAIAAESAFEECKLLPMEQWFEHGTDPEQVVEYAKNSIDLWWNNETSLGVSIKDMVSQWKWLGSEVYWNEEWDNYALHGYIDSVYESDKNIIVVDNKTASSMRRWKYEQDMNLETSLYVTLAEIAQSKKLLPQKPIIFQYHVMAAKEGKSRIIEMPEMKTADYEMLNQALNEATVIKNYNAYRPKPDWNLCSSKYCAYFEGCRINGTLSPYSLTISNIPTEETSTSASSTEVPQ